MKRALISTALVLFASAVLFAGGKAESLAFRFTFGETSIGYTGDAALSPELIEFMGGADLLLSECTASPGTEEDALEYGHLTPRQAGIIALA